MLVSDPFKSSVRLGGWRPMFWGGVACNWVLLGTDSPPSLLTVEGRMVTPGL